MQIGILAKKSGISRDAIRLYEQKGMLLGITRPNVMNDYKDYPVENFDRIKIIKLLKQYGFTLKECGAMLQIFDSSHSNCKEVKKLISEKILVVNQKLEELFSLKKLLQSALVGKEFKLVIETNIESEPPAD